MRKLSEVEIARFWSRVLRGQTDECWPWQGARRSKRAKSRSGQYGIIAVDGRNYGAHRIAYAIAKNGGVMLPPSSPFGINIICHSCDNPPCCNPDHLMIGTYKDNAEQRESRGRRPNGCFKGGVDPIPADVVREIRRMAMSWEGMCDMMKKHRLNQSVVEDIRDRKTRRHIPD